MKWFLEPLKLHSKRQSDNTYQGLSWEVKKLGEMICTYRELKNLKSLHIALDITCPLDDMLMRAFPNTPDETSADDLWEQVDRQSHGCFSKLLESVLKKTLKGFQVHKHVVRIADLELLWEPYCDKHSIQDLHMELRKA